MIARTISLHLTRLMLRAPELLREPRRESLRALSAIVVGRCMMEGQADVFGLGRSVELHAGFVFGTLIPFPSVSYLPWF
jgi:hypothetical protein